MLVSAEPPLRHRIQPPQLRQDAGRKLLVDVLVDELPDVGSPLGVAGPVPPQLPAGRREATMVEHDLPVRVVEADAEPAWACVDRTPRLIAFSSRRQTRVAGTLTSTAWATARARLAPTASAASAASATATAAGR